MPSIQIAPNARVFIAGQTGSGKTTLCQAFLLSVPRLLVIDPQDSLDDWVTAPWTPDNRERWRKGDQLRLRVIYTDDALTALADLYKSGNGIVYVDEATALIQPGKPAPMPVVDVWTRGRKRNIGAWVAAQRPHRVPLEFISEAQHLFVFRLNLERDRARMAEVGGPRLLARPVDRYGFWYYSAFDDATPTLFAGLP